MESTLKMDTLTGGTKSLMDARTCEAENPIAAGVSRIGIEATNRSELRIVSVVDPEVAYPAIRMNDW